MKEQAIKDIVNKMFEIAGHDVDYSDIVKNGKRYDYTITPDQRSEWLEWGKNYLIENTNEDAKHAESEMMWTDLKWCLRVVNPETIENEL